MSDVIKSIHYVVVVYGSDYLDTFLKVTFNNLKFLIREIDRDINQNSVLKIYTDSEGYVKLTESLSLLSLENFVSINVIDYISGLDEDMPYGGYSHMVRCQEHAVKQAWKSKSILFFIGPDQIYPKGSFSEFIHIIKAGKRIIVGFAPRILKIPTTQFIADRSEYFEDGFALDRAEQIDLFQHFTHPVNNQFVPGEKLALREKAYIYQLSDQELTFRSFQGPTLVAWPKKDTGSFSGFIDHNLISYCVSDVNEYHLLGNVDKIVPLDLTDDRRIDGMGSAFSKIWQIDLLCFLIDKRQPVNLYQLFFSLNYSVYNIESIRGEISGLRKIDSRRQNKDIESIIMLASIIRFFRSKNYPLRSKIIELIIKHNLFLLLRFNNLIRRLSASSINWLRSEIISKN